MHNWIYEIISECIWKQYNRSREPTFFSEVAPEVQKGPRSFWLLETCHVWSLKQKAPSKFHGLEWNNQDSKNVKRNSMETPISKSFRQTRQIPKTVLHLDCNLRFNFTYHLHAQ